MYVEDLVEDIKIASIDSEEIINQKMKKIQAYRLEFFDLTKSQRKLIHEKCEEFQLFHWSQSKKKCFMHF